ncbi:MAG: hypothetical protein JL55_26405 [Pseudomonas sp. BICA1-14]|nr:MAG: hypothetical protein JL55_26405 [[Pseudomonas] sp. BICA1-14]
MADCYATTQHRTGCDMHMGSHMTVVVNAGPGIHDATAADDDIGLQYSTGHYLDPFLQHNGFVDPGCGMDQRRKAKASGTGTFVHSLAKVASHDLTDTVDQLDLVRSIPLQCIIRAEHLETAPMAGTLLDQARIADTDHLVAKSTDQ